MKSELFKTIKEGYSLQNLVSDLSAGLLVAIIALPLSMALGIQSGGTLMQGIVTAIVAGFCISAFGGSKFQIGGPTAAFVVILLGYVNDPNIGFSGLYVATIMAGIILILLGVFKIGKLVKFVPFTVVTAFTTGIGITLFIGQLHDFLGETLKADGEFLHKVFAIIKNVYTANPWTIVVGIVTVALIVYLPKLNEKLPSAFIAIVVSTLLLISVDAITGKSHGVATVGSTYGNVKAEFNFLPSVDFGGLNISKLIMPSIIIAFLASIESLLSATVADGMTKQEHNPNQELIGQGIGNIASSLFCGLPATGAIARTSASINAGAKTSFAGVFHAVFLLIMYIVLMPIVKYVPLCCLSAVLITVSIRMSNFKLFFKLFKFTFRCKMIVIVTCLLTVFFDLTYGVLGGMAFAVLSTFNNVLHGAKLYEIPSESDEVKNYKMQNNLGFLAVVGVCDKLRNDAKSYKEIVIDVDGIVRFDVTAVERIVKLTTELKAQNVELKFVNASDRIKRLYKQGYTYILGLSEEQYQAEYSNLIK